MNRRISKWLLACGCTFVMHPAVSLAADPSSFSLTSERFARLHSMIKPTTGEEKWAQIPWLTSLWQARWRAAAEGKPILLWEMDGHPLGCT